jgi:hypothetical protein
VFFQADRYDEASTLKFFLRLFTMLFPRCFGQYLVIIREIDHGKSLLALHMYHACTKCNILQTYE